MKNILEMFIENELNNNNQNLNAIAYLVESFEGGNNYKVTFERRHREQYNKLLHFCADNNLTLISTQAATLATIIRIEE